MTEIKELIAALREDARQMWCTGLVREGSTPLAEQAASALEALISRSAVMEEAWQPIETAPKDGTEVLFHHPSYGAVRGAWRDTGDEFGMIWAGTYMMPGLTAKAQPTRWRPLPEPPARSALSLKAGKE